ncbi:hypothetical protein DBV15_01697 [Temnothorax longispinosus]|uniref:Uncharacterized protein n=1 Tax=Temnothorax longispinosus TaxID=300112 RepID=A0A4S2L245_9HYME|nr:hypothetical protein DBV15_01697 [Temnothorax longispinosus]
MLMFCKNHHNLLFIAIQKLLFEAKASKRGKGRLYPAYSLSGSEGEDNTSSLRGRAYPQNNHQTNQSHHNHYNTSQHKQRAYQQQQQHPLYHMPGSGAGLSDTPTSGNASDETLTDSDLITVARDSALLVHNGERFLDFCIAAVILTDRFMEQSLPVESGNRLFRACTLNFENFFNFSLIRMLITASARSEGSNKAGLTKKVGAIAWLEVREIAWQPLDMA